MAIVRERDSSARRVAGIVYILGDANGRAQCDARTIDGVGNRYRAHGIDTIINIILTCSTRGTCVHVYRSGPKRIQYFIMDRF